MPHRRSITLAVLTTALAFVAIASTSYAGGACEPAQCQASGGAPYQWVPKKVIAPKGFYKSFLRQFRLARDICTFPAVEYLSPYEAQYYHALVNRFNAERGKLNVRMNRSGLGFAPSLGDWLAVRRFQAQSGSVLSMICPVG